LQFLHFSLYIVAHCSTFVPSNDKIKLSENKRNEFYYVCLRESVVQRRRRLTFNEEKNLRRKTKSLARRASRESKPLSRFSLLARERP
jgi:hypothetical protein